MSVPVPGTKTAKTFQFRAHPSNSWMWFVGFRYAIGYNLRRERVNHLLGRHFHSSKALDS